MLRDQQSQWQSLVENIAADVCSRFRVVDYVALQALAENFLCDDPQLTVLRLAELLRTLPAAFKQLNSLFQLRKIRVELAQRSPITCFVLKTPDVSSILCLEPLRNLSPSLHNFSTTQLRHVLTQGTVGGVAHDDLYGLTDPELRDCLAQLAQDVLDNKSFSGNSRKVVLGFLRRCGGVPLSLFLPGLSEGGLFCMTFFSDLYYGALGDRRVVIKKPRYSKGSLNNTEIMREVALYRQCNHPHILEFLGVSEEQHRLYGLVSPYMKHGNVIKFLERHRSIDRLTPVWQIMQGLAYLHSFDPPIAHRDVKGTNVLVDDELNCRLADLGLSSIPELSQRAHELAIGTPTWMAPEILLPPEHGRVDLVKVDIFALGITAYEVLEGKPPVTNTNIYAAIAARLIQKETFSFPPNVFPSLLSQLIEGMCQTNPSLRPDVSTVIQQFESGLKFPRMIQFSEETDNLWAPSADIARTMITDQSTLATKSSLTSTTTTLSSFPCKPQSRLPTPPTTPPTACRPQPETP